MNYFLIGAGIALVSLTISAYALVVSTHTKLGKMEEKLKEKGVLEDDWEQDNE